MTDLERKVALFALRHGWEVYRRGWPDFLIYRRTPEFKAVAIEVKKDKDFLTPHQKTMHNILIEIGLPTLILKENYFKSDLFKYHPKKTLHGYKSDLILRDI